MVPCAAHVVYIDNDHRPMISSVTNIWDIDYIRIGDYECDLVPSEYVKYDKLLNTEIKTYIMIYMSDTPRPHMHSSKKTAQEKS